MMKLRLLVVGIIACWSCGSGFAEVSFVQITDPHIFDCKGDVEGNKEALKWCINQINERAGAKADFIVVTGDLGLEGLPCGGKEKEPAVDRAKELADIVKQSKVKQWLFLPGNNDLVGENPDDIGTFHGFIKTLKDQLPEMQIVDFCPVAGENSSGVLELGGCRFIGFNNASFKSNDLAKDANAFQPKQLENVDEVIARMADRNFKSAYIFYHIPEIDDPYCVSLDPNKPEQNDILKKRAAGRGDIPFFCSAWTVTSAVREKWNQVVANERVKGLFAGHYHSSQHESYDGLDWIRSAGYSSASLLKLHVCPPVASKKQENAPSQARGFREVSVDCETGKIKSSIVWYEKNAASPLKIVEKDLVLSVDPANNTASGLLHLSNPTAKEIPLSLSADDFKSSTGNYGLNTKVLFALATGSAAGQTVFEAKLAPSSTIAIKVEVSNFWEAGEATANLCNYGEPFGKLRATKWRPAFAVKIISPIPDKPEFAFTKYQPRQITLKNDDAMTYQVAVAVEVDGTWSAPSRATLTPNGSTSLDLHPPEEWFPSSAAVKESIRDGTIKIQWPAPAAGNQPPQVERIIAFKAHLNSVGEFWQTVWSYLFVLIFLTVGGVCSMLLSNWVPNRLSRADIEEQLNDLARKTTGLSTRIDSGLRVFLRVERHRLQGLLRSRSVFSANFPDVVKRSSDKIAGLDQQVDLAGQLDRAREALEPLQQSDPIPAKITIVDHDLQTAADLLRRSDCKAEDLEKARQLILGAADRISKMDQTDSELVAELSRRIASLKTFVQPATEPDALKELKKLFPKLFGSFDPCVVTNLDPSQYSSVDLITAQLELIRRYQAYYNASPPQPNFPRQEEGVKYFHSDTIMGLRRAKLLLREIREGIFVEDIERAITNGQAEIVVEPSPVEDQLARFTIRFRSEDLNTAAARDELRCDWDFGHNNLKETGWEAYHYFPQPPRGFWHQRWRDIWPWRKRESKTYTVKAMFSRKAPVNGNQSPLIIAKPIDVSEPPESGSADRNFAEGVRLAIVLAIALIGLLAGAREQLTKLDVIPAAIAVLLLGFGADTIKNLISPKQAQK